MFMLFLLGHEFELRVAKEKVGTSSKGGVVVATYKAVEGTKIAIIAIAQNARFPIANILPDVNPPTN